VAGEACTLTTENIPVDQAKPAENIEEEINAIDNFEIPQLKIDPEIQYLCKPLDSVAYDLLVADIQKNSCIDQSSIGKDTILS
jgi:hypothetical protein